MTPARYPGISYLSRIHFSDGIVAENMSPYAVLSDLILVIHFAFVTFVVGGFVVVWIGHFRHWEFVRSFVFRLAHLLTMGLVLFQSLAGIVCPLTRWENAMRLRAGEGLRYEQSCIEHWLGRILFHEVTEQMFTLTYLGFFVLLALTFWRVPPRWPRKRLENDST